VVGVESRVIRLSAFLPKGDMQIEAEVLSHEVYPAGRQLTNNACHHHFAVTPFGGSEADWQRVRSLQLPLDFSFNRAAERAGDRQAQLQDLDNRQPIY
jgi:hypothetical protein